MSRFHESLREILEEVHYFVSVTLNQEVLSTTTITRREALLQKLEEVKNAYPQLHLDFACPQPVATLSTRMPRASVEFFLGPPPPPYEDMNGNTISEGVELLEARYEPSFRLRQSSDSLPKAITYVETDCRRTSDSEPGSLDDCKFLKYGYLGIGKERLGGLIKSSQQRWYIIKGGVMNYYDKPIDKYPRGSIPLQGYEARCLQSKDKKGHYAFEIVCPGKRTYQFSAPSEKEMKEWIAVIETNSKVDSQSCVASAKSVDTSHGETEDIYELVDEKDECESEASCCQGTVCVRVGEGACLADLNSSLSELDYQNLYVGLWDCQSEDSCELEFSRGDVIHILSKEYDSYSWWIGELHGRVGFVPKSYLMEAYQVFY